MNSKQNMILKKESIQLQVPLQLPCYDFTTIINNTVKISTRVEHQQVFFVSGTFYVKTQINVFFWVQFTFRVWRAVCTRLRYKFTVACWSTITSDSNFMQASCSLQSELRRTLMGLASSREFATRCIRHCSMCVAQDIRAMMTWRRPLLPLVLNQQFHQSAHPKWWQLIIGVALVTGLNRTPHGTSWRQPCSTCVNRNE